MQKIDYHSTLISPLAIAPMIDWTTRHFRYFMRLLAPRALLYTEMHTPGAMLNKSSILNYHSYEKPLALQIGGADPDALVKCAKLAQELGFAEININLGCPSDRVQAGRFGACLMKDPQLVSECIYALKSATHIPVTAKTRIGIDDEDSYEFFSAFMHTLVNAGVDKIIVHARKAWLKGLSPKQNRTIPPLHYPYVYRIKSELLEMPIVINGNITTFSEIADHLDKVDGVMIGRLAYQNPYAISEMHHQLFSSSLLEKRSVILEKYIDYALDMYDQNINLGFLIKPIFNFAHGLKNSKQWKLLLMKILDTKNIALLTETIALLSTLESSTI